MKKLIAVLLSILSVIVLAIGVAGCNSGTDELQSKINVLQSQLEEMNDRLTELENENKELNAKIDELWNALAAQSSLARYTLQAAYNNGWLTQTDLAYAMYYACGEVYTCDELDWENGNTEAVTKIDFVPEVECPTIHKQVEREIKKYYLERMNLEEDLTFEEFEQNFSFRFVGSYNGTFVITDLKTIYWGYPTDVPPPIWIAGFVWSGSYANDLFVFRYE